MADRKISDLTALTTPASGDYLPIVDISEAAAASKNKRITVEELMRGAPDGTAAAPSIAFESDPNTGIYSPGADQLAISTNAVERVEFGTAEVVFNDGGANYDFRIEGDTNANLFFVDASTDRVGLGTSSPAAQFSVTPAANSEAIRVGATGGISTINGGYVTLTSNAKSFGNASDFQNILASAAVGLGVISPMRSPFSNTVGGVWVATGNATANTTYAWSSMTPALTWNTSGQVGIGTTSPARVLDVTPSSVNAVAARFGNVAGRGLEISTFLTQTVNDAGVAFNALGAGVGAIAFQTDSSERARIDSDGRLLVGTSSDSGGALLQVNGNRIRIATANTPASAGATGTTGEIAWDADYIYVCTATNTWKRTAIATW
jgi:hypothetical protein